MAFLRISSLVRPALSSSNIVLRSNPIVSSSVASLKFQDQRRLASQDYGSGSGSPEGENPQKQPSSTITSDKEHPGPPPPDVGKGTGGGPTKKDEGGHGPPHKGPSGKQGKKDVSEAQPKILSDGQGQPKEESEEVRRHNEDMGKRHDRPTEGVDDQGKDYVDKGFWKGQGGADRNP